MSSPTAIEGPTRRYILKSQIATGDLCDVYEAVYANGGGDNHVVVKIARDKQDNDLVWNEAGVLGFLHDGETTHLKRYLPTLIDAFEGKGGHRVNVLERLNGWLSLEEIIRAYPKGLNFRDMVWMYKRLLVAIGFAHTKGVIHGAILPSHVMVHPVEHGAKLLDWSYSLNFAELLKPPPPDPAVKTPKVAATKARTTAWAKLLEDSEIDPDSDPVRVAGPPADPNRMYIRAISVQGDESYPPEVFLKQTPTPATDIFMAAKIAVREIDPGHIHPRLDHRLHHFPRCRRRPDRGHNFGFLFRKFHGGPPLMRVTEILWASAASVYRRECRTLRSRTYRRRGRA